MSWTFDEIAHEWLADSVVAVPPEEVVIAYNRCEQTLGREWINQCRGTVIGAAPTLQVVTIGQRLASLDGVGSSEQLIEKLRKRDPSATAELHALHLLRSNGETSLELFPRIIVGDRMREPDFRIRRNGHPWVYAEVTSTDISEAHERAEAVLDTLSAVIDSVTKPFDLEVFLRREPQDQEISCVLPRILRFCESASAGREELPDGLGLLLLSGAPSGPIVPNDHGEEVRPRLGKAKFKVEQGVPTRRVVVRMPYSDERAENLLRRESAQLPPEGPGLVMIHMGNAPGGFSSWEPLIRRRFQPSVHTRVGAVCLFSAGTLPTERGFVILSQTKVLVNPHASTPLPSWIEKTLIAAGEEFRKNTVREGPIAAGSVDVSHA